MPAGASHVKVVTDTATYPATHTGVREFSATAVPTPPVPGPWELDVEFTLHGRAYTTPGSVVTVTSRSIDSRVPIGQSRRLRPSRKVGTPQSRVPGNSRTGKPDGKRNRKQTASRRFVVGGKVETVV